MSEHPICERCGKNLTQEVHHIIPLERFKNHPEKMEEMAYSLENVMCLCKDCHFAIHREMGQKKGISKKKQIEAHHRFTNNFLRDFLDIDNETD